MFTGSRAEPDAKRYRFTGSDCVNKGALYLIESDDAHQGGKDGENQRGKDGLQMNCTNTQQSQTEKLHGRRHGIPQKKPVSAGKGQLGNGIHNGTDIHPELQTEAHQKGKVPEGPYLPGAELKSLCSTLMYR